MLTNKLFRRTGFAEVTGREAVLARVTGQVSRMMRGRLAEQRHTRDRCG
jgi:hypothetical protein